jgi:hypothetical protein
LIAAPSPTEPALRFHELLVQGAPDYLARFGPAMPTRQRQVLQHILDCRTAVLGGRLFVCPECGLSHYAYHSCNDRHCPQCGQADADQWLEAQSSRLLPVDYFLVTFTVPEGLRGWMRSQPQLGYDALFAASSRALLDLAANPRRLGAQLGMWGVLHTWTRTLIYHPHIHYLVPAGGLSLDGQRWVATRSEFLVRVEPLSDHFRTCFRQRLAENAPTALATIAPRVWQQRWVTHSQPAGSGQSALRYLSRYVFQTATGNRRLTPLPDGRVLWKYRDSDTRQWRSIALEKQELIRRFLQHVLPAGYHRVRRFGWLHPAAKARRQRVELLLGQAEITPALMQLDPPLDAIEKEALPEPARPGAPSPPAPAARKVFSCPRCAQPMCWIGSLWRSHAAHRPSPARAPPAA